MDSIESNFEDRDERSEDGSSVLELMKRKMSAVGPQMTLAQWQKGKTDMILTFVLGADRDDLHVFLMRHGADG